MKKTEKFSKSNSAELRLYRLLGIGLFKKGILLFEKLRHRKDAGRNRNYHPETLSLSALQSFSAYLFYNAAIHLAGLGLALLYFLIVFFNGAEAPVLHLLMLLAALLHLYCLMLQRYSFLRIKGCIAGLLEKRDRRAKKALPGLLSHLRAKEEQALSEEYRLLCRLSDHAALGRDLLLTEAQIAPLERIGEAAAHLQGAHLKRTPFRKGSLSLAKLSPKGRAYVVEQKEQAAAGLWRLMGRRSNRSPLFEYSIITDSAATEAAWQKSFGGMGRDRFEERLSLLLSAYRQEGRVSGR